MKNLIVSLSVSMFLFIAGCQDSPMDPVSNDKVYQSEVEKTGTPLHGIIPLQGMLVDPHHVGNSYYIVSGQIKYTYRISYRDPVSPTAQKYLLIRFETNADFQYFCTLCTPPAEDVLAGFVTNQSDDYVQLGGSSVTEYEKSFPVQGTESGMTLKVKFRISYNRIELSAMWLALSSSNETATEIKHY